jgi:hypothetical protein
MTRRTTSSRRAPATAAILAPLLGLLALAAPSVAAGGPQQTGLTVGQRTQPADVGVDVPGNTAASDARLASICT